MYTGEAPEFAAVLYRPGDLVGFCCAVASLIPPWYLFAHLAVFLCRREAQDLWFGIGQVVCEGSNKVFKYLLRSPRPPNPVLNMPKESFGMPSAHSQFMGYVFGYTLLQVLASKRTPFWERVFHVGAIGFLAALVGFSRWYLYYHSASQVLGGLGIGALLGMAWFAASRPLRKWGVVDWLLTLWPCRIFYVKDTDYDVAHEYELWRASRLPHRKTQ